MPNTRGSIIKKAIKTKLGNGFEVFTAEDILIVANIDDSQIKKLEIILDEEAASIAEDNSNP